MGRVAAVLAVLAVAIVGAQPAGATVPKRGDLRVLVALVTWDAPVATPAQVQTELAEVATWFEETSFSQIHVVAETTPGWLTIPQFSGCASINPDLHDAADAALRGAAVDVTRYNVVAYLFPTLRDCSFGGRASLQTGWVELNGFYDNDLIQHELGHSLGLWHSRSTPCTVWRSDCFVDEYGDPYDVMGDGAGPFNGFQKLQLGWISGTPINRNGTYSVEQLERPSAAAQALTIETAAARYVIDHRDASLEPAPPPGAPRAPDPTEGVLIYRWGDAQGPVLLSSGGAPRAYPLPVGRSYEVPGIFRVTPAVRVGTRVDVAFAWTDSTPPDPPVLVEPGDRAVVRNAEEPVLMWDDALETGSGLAGYELTLDGRRTALSTAETSWAPAGNFGAGTHTWSVAAIDRAGNRSASPRRSFTVGRLTQTVSVLFGGRRCGTALAAPCRLRGRTFRFVVEAPDAPLRATVAVTLERRGAGWETAVRRSERVNAVGNAGFAKLPALQPGLWRVTAAIDGDADVSPARAVAYVRLSD